MMNWLHGNWLGIILIMTMTTFLFWAFGYLANGLYLYHFELGSCWAGMGAIATAGAAGWGKWAVDSKWNTNQGVMPDQNQGGMKK